MGERLILLRGGGPLGAAARGPQGQALDGCAGAAGQRPARRPRMNSFSLPGGSAPRSPPSPHARGQAGISLGATSLAWWAAPCGPGGRLLRRCPRTSVLLGWPAEPRPPRQSVLLGWPAFRSCPRITVPLTGRPRRRPNRSPRRADGQAVHCSECGGSRTGSGPRPFREGCAAPCGAAPGRHHRGPRSPGQRHRRHLERAPAPASHAARRAGPESARQGHPGVAGGGQRLPRRDGGVPGPAARRRSPRAGPLQPAQRGFRWPQQPGLRGGAGGVRGHPEQRRRAPAGLAGGPAGGGQGRPPDRERRLPDGLRSTPRT